MPGASQGLSGSMRPTDKPPDRRGLSASVVALPVGGWATFLDFLADRFPAISRAEWSARMADGDILDESGSTIRLGVRYRPHGKLFYYRSVAVEPEIPFAETVLFQDDFLVVADKPHFLPVTPAGRYAQQTLLVRLKRKLGIETLAPMHRIDRDTAGLVLFTVQPGTRNAYQRLFRERDVEKIYEAIAPWRSDLTLPTIYRSRLIESAQFMQMREAPGEPNAETAIDVLEVRGALARYQLRPHSGRKHQLRAHMNALAIPIVNDRIYPLLQPHSAGGEDFDHPLQLLAKKLAFTDPVNGEARCFESRRQLSQFMITTLG